MLNIEKYKKEMLDRLEHCKEMDQNDMDALFKELGEALYNTTTIPEDDFKKSKNKCEDIFNWFCDEYKPETTKNKTLDFVTTLVIDKFVCDNASVKFNSPFVINAFSDGEYFYASNKVFCFDIKGKEIDDLIKRIELEFLFIYEDYLPCMDEYLNEEGLRIKYEFKKMLDGE